MQTQVSALVEEETSKQIATSSALVYSEVKMLSPQSVLTKMKKKIMETKIAIISWQIY